MGAHKARPYMNHQPSALRSTRSAFNRAQRSTVPGSCFAIVT
ncbi:hypothetical protein SAMN05444173_1127 [Opitutus sp. GAS368]|nr:hypothetical protein SAMN05444173_1127 [Opitutus sp. GAS368]